MTKKLFIYGRGVCINNHYLHCNSKQKVYIKNVCDERKNTAIDFNTNKYSKLIGKVNDYVITFDELNIEKIIDEKLKVYYKDIIF